MDNDGKAVTGPPPAPPRPRVWMTSPIAVREFVHILWENFWVVLATAVVALGIAQVYLYYAKPLYTAKARLCVEHTGPKALAEFDGLPVQQRNNLFTQAELLKSTPILRAAIEQPQIRQMACLAAREDPIQWLKGALDVKVSRDHDIISVLFDSTDPEEGARLINSIVDSYIAYNTEHHRSSAGEVLKILQKEKAKRDAEAKTCLDAILEFKKANGALTVSREGAAVSAQRLGRLSDAMTASQLEATSAKADLEAAQALLAGNVGIQHILEAQTGRAGPLGPGGEMAARRAERARLELQLTALKQDCTGDHPAVQALQARINQLGAEITAEEKGLAEAYLATVRQRYLAAQARKDQTEVAFKEQQDQAAAANLKAAELEVFQANLVRAERLCEILDGRIKETSAGEDAGALNISVVEPAVAEKTPSFPKPLQILAVAALAGFILGCCMAMLRDLTDQRLHSSEEIAVVMGLPVLAVVPAMRSRVRRPGTLVHDEPGSATAEAYRAVRTAVYYGAPAGASKRLLVTSPDPGDGKSTLAANLAISMAQAGQRTLLLDADFRRPTQHKLFEVPSETGLSTVLAGNLAPQEAIRPTVVPGLDVLPCGPIPKNPAELLSGRAFKQFLKQLSDTYDHVVIDSPPVGAVTDACILGATCDMTLLVLRAEKSTRGPSERARDSLVAVGANIQGIIVNAVPRRRGKYYSASYGGYGGYHYGYGYSHEPLETRPLAPSKSRRPATVNEN